ncbi:MAG: tyrosine-type recombinase/integrase, partial [Elusimicrobiota bacterium]
MRKLWTGNIGGRGVANYAQAVDLFMLRCRSKNLSAHSIEWYKFLLGGLTRFLEASPRETTPNHLRAYLDSLRRRGLSSITIDRTYGGLRCFFRYLSQERIIPQNPITLVEKPKKSKPLIKPLNLDQVRLLLAQPRTKTFVGFRNWVMMLTLLDTGLRLSEILSLRRDRIDWQGSRFLVQGKGDKERTVPFGVAVKKALWEYAQWRGEVAGQDIFFLDQFGGKICTRHVQITIKRYGKTAGIEGVRVSPHTLRHTFATQYIRNGGDPFSLQAILGHSTLEMVRNYVNLASR